MVALRDGIQSGESILRLKEAGVIRTAAPFAADQVQPASLDLRLGAKAYRVRASFLPGPNRPVRDRLGALSLHEIDLTPGAVLETGCVYIAELQEGLALPKDVSAAANPKSSTGRIDVFTRVITDRAQEFDTIEAGYEGPLYAEISPAFSMASTAPRPGARAGPTAGASSTSCSISPSTAPSPSPSRSAIRPRTACPPRCSCSRFT